MAGTGRRKSMKDRMAGQLMSGLMAGLLSLPASVTASVTASAEEPVDYLLLWVIAGGDYVDSGFRFDAAGGCFAKAQNIANDMQFVGMSAPQFTCVPLKAGHDFNVSRQPQSGSRFPF